jgi:outer membrane protein TolC
VLSAQQQLITAQERLDNIADRPKVGAFATLGYGRPGLNALNDTFDTYFIGGVQLTVPLTYLYTGTHRKAQRQAELQQALLSKQQAAVLSQINVQLDTQRAEIARLDAGLLLDDELIGLRGKARQQTETQLALGTATMTDLVNDLTQEDQARSKQALHRAQRSLACHQLELAAGNL